MHFIALLCAAAVGIVTGFALGLVVAVAIAKGATRAAIGRRLW